MRGDGRSAAGVLAAILALLGIGIAIPANVVSGYLPPSVTSRRALWVGVLACGALAAMVLTWLSNGQSRRPPAILSQVPPVPGWVDRGELAKVLSALGDGKHVGEGLAC
jgi:hypothetical protein